LHYDNKDIKINTPLGGIYWLGNRVPDNLRAAVGKREEKFSLKMLDPVEAKRLCAAALVALEERRGSGSTSVAGNLPSASLAVSTAITFAFLA
jgi:hypothetical protein